MRIASLVAFSFMVLALASPAHAASQCLQSASNSDLVLELQRRLDAGGGGNAPSAAAVATYSCTNNSWEGPRLVVNLTNTVTGSTDNLTLNSASIDDCQAQAQLLNRHTAVTAPKVVASCTNNSWEGPKLTRLMIRPDGTLQALTSLSSSSLQECINTASAINGG